MAIARKSVPEHVILRVAELCNYALLVSFGRQGDFDSSNAVSLRMRVALLERQMPWLREYYDDEVLYTLDALKKEIKNGGYPDDE